MIEKYFENLCAIEGVEAFALVDNGDHIIDTWTNSRYDSSIFSEIGESYLQIFGIEENLNFNVDEIIVLFDRGLIFIRYQERFLLMVIAKSTADISYMRLAINVGIFELEESKKFQKVLKKLPREKPHQFQYMQLDDVERLILNKIAENFNASGNPD